MSLAGQLEWTRGELLASLAREKELLERLDRLERLKKLLQEQDLDLTHYWRCGAQWAKRSEGRSTDPLPQDPLCDCGLREVSELLNE